MRNLRSSETTTDQTGLRIGIACIGLGGLERSEVGNHGSGAVDSTPGGQIRRAMDPELTRGGVGGSLLI